MNEVQRSILGQIRPVIGMKAREEPGYRFIADNGRVFHIWDMRERHPQPSRAFFMEEMRPNGKVITQIKPYVECEQSEAVLRLLESPNDFEAALAEVGIDSESLVYVGSGFGVYTRYFASLEACAATIADYLERNAWYDAQDHDLMADPDYQRHLKKLDAEERRHFQAAERTRHEQSMRLDHGLFKGLYAMTGPLSEDAKRRILAFLNAPSKANWDAVARYIVKGSTTMWQLWASFDPEAPRSLPSTDGPERWPTVPEPERMRNALLDLGRTAP